jgi:ABC-2 type transport system permease protein
VTGTLSAGIEITSLEKRGESTFAAQVGFEPIRPELRTLFNPLLNYQYFLVAGLLPAMLQVFVMVWSVYVVGREFRERSTGEWLSAGRNIYFSIAAKVLPVFVVGSAIGLGCLAWIHGYAGWPVEGSLGILILGWELMICAYLVLGLLVVGLAPQLATALSFTAAFTAPAFAYAGITFPQQAMPAVAQLWSYALPIRTLLRLQVEQAQIGASVSSSVPELLILVGFVLLPLPVAIRRIRTRCNTAVTQGQT